MAVASSTGKHSTASLVADIYLFVSGNRLIVYNARRHSAVSCTVRAGAETASERYADTARKRLDQTRQRVDDNLIAELRLSAFTGTNPGETPNTFTQDDYLQLRLS